MTTLGQYFKSGTRDDGSTFTSTTDECPEWLKDAIQEAHQGDLPNDWIYATCEAACDAIDDGALTDEDSLHEWSDGQVDIYTKELAAWYADMCNSFTFSNAEEEAESIGVEDGSSIDDRLKAIQYAAIRVIGQTMFEAVQENREDDEEEDADDDESEDEDD